MHDLHYIEISHKCGGLRTDSAWLAAIAPALGCRCGNLIAPRKINVRMLEELNYSVLYAAFFERSQKIRVDGRIKSVGRNVDKGGLIPIVDEQILDAIGPTHFEQSFYIGDVEFVASCGKRKFASLVPKSNSSQVFIRGSSASGVRFCSVCKAFPVYSIGIPFAPYILKRDTSGLAPVLGSPNGSFLVRSDLSDSLSNFRRTYHSIRIQVLDEPLDELPEDLLRLPREFSRPLRRPTDA